MLWKQSGGFVRNGGMEYRCVATSVAGFVQQLVSCYLPHGYWFYVSGIIPPGKVPATVDEKLIGKYGIGLSRTSRARRKAMGIANVRASLEHDARAMGPRAMLARSAVGQRKDSS